MDRETINFNFPDIMLNIKSIKSSKKAQYRGLHSHSAIELVHINTSDVLCYINDEAINLSSGDTILINSHVIHRLCAKSALDIKYIQIDLTKLLNSSTKSKRYYIDEYINHKNIKPYIISKDGELTDIFNRIEKEAEKKENGFELYIKAYSHQIVAFMHRHSMLKGHTGNLNPSLIKIMPIILHIEENYTSPLSLDFLASLIPCDKFALCKLFKKATGGTVIDYINFIRILKSFELLSSTNKSILEIALECGFTSVEYFNRCFKQNAGCTPSAYRKM